MLVIDNLPEGSFTLEIRNTCAPEKNTQLSGLYTSGGGFFTQCEAEGFRRITFFLDRPDVMAEYSVLIRAEQGRLPGAALERQPGRAGRPRQRPPLRRAGTTRSRSRATCSRWSRPGLVAREQRIRSRSGKDHLLQVWVREGDLDKTEQAMESLVASVVWDEARFGLPLDLERFMIVAVGDFNMGAMENKGLNLFNTKYVLANPATATDDDYAAIESVVGHEYFHNWTGNRITCRDWFQLSLKEGLTVFRDQEFSMDMVASPSARAPSPDRDGARACASRSSPRTPAPMAHPVRPDSYVEINNFYTSTIYEKGAEVVRMMQTLVGREGFERGMTLYFQRHDGQAVTCDDFAQAIADANPAQRAGEAACRSSSAGTRQAGTPRLTARGRYDAPSRTFTLGLEQSCAPTAGRRRASRSSFRWRSACSAATAGRWRCASRTSPRPRRRPTRMLVLDDTKAFFTFVDVDEPPVLSLLRGFSAPVVLVDGLGDADLLILLRHDSDPFNRWEAGQRLALNRLLAAVAGDVEAPLDAGLHRGDARVLRQPSLDPAFKALALTLPSEVYVAEQLDSVDPQRVHAAREAMRRQLAHRPASTTGSGRSNAHQVSGGYSPDPVSSGRRALANLALRDALHRRAPERRSGLAGPRLAALQGRRQHDRPPGRADRADGLGVGLADAAFERFHAIFRNDALVLDKWFAAAGRRAGARGQGVRAGQAAARATRTSTSPIPNRARSLIGTFCLGNPGGLPSRRRRRLRLLGRPRHRPRRDQSAGWHRASRARSTAGATSPSPIARRRARRSRGSLRSAKLSDDTQRDRLARASRRRLRWPAAKPRRKNAFYAQSGGVTAVINASAARRDRDRARAPRRHRHRLRRPERHHRRAHRGPDRHRQGVGGGDPRAAHDARRRVRLVPLQAEVARHEPARVRAADRGLPGARHRLVLLQRRRRLGRHLLQGEPAVGQSMGYPLQAIHVPKTVDNDLPITDCCPGFGSVAKYVAVSALEASFDVRSMARTSTKVFVLEVMGRHAGWIAAAGGLIEEHGIPVVILFPEIEFDEAKFIARVDALVKEHGYCTVVVSEGAHRADGTLPRRAGHARTPSATPSSAAPRRWSRTWSRTRSATSSTGRSPTTCSAPRATSPRRPTCARPTSSASARSSWR